MKNSDTDHMNDDKNLDQTDTAVEDISLEELGEDGDPTGGATTGPGAIKKLRERLEKAVEEKQQYLDGWQRAKADFANFQKRVTDEKKELIKFANEDLVNELIPALDSFDMAMGNKEAWEKVDKNWRVGVEYIYTQLLNALATAGVAQDNPIGKDFNPTTEEATELIQTDKKEDDGKVLQVIQKGYMLNGKAIRPAKVKVGEYKK